MAPGRSDDFLRKRSNEERAQDYSSITMCLWKPYSDHKTNSIAAIAEYKSHTLRLCLSIRVQNVHEKLRLSLFLKTQTKKGGRGVGDISRPLSHPALWVPCLCVYVFTCVYLAAWCESVASMGVVSHPEGKPYELKGQTRLLQRL